MKKTITVLMMVLLAAMLIISCDDSQKAPYSAGDIVKYGKYPDNYAFEDLKGDAITWKVLSVDAANSRMLVISERTLEKSREFNSSSSYSGSSIQSYLNGDFITTYGLSDVDICNVDVTTEIEKTKVGSGSDKVFLLSKTEAENKFYFADNAARISCYTDNYKPAWWLRTANGGNVYSVTMTGSLDNNTTPSYTIGLRPAFWVSF